MRQVNGMGLEMLDLMWSRGREGMGFEAGMRFKAGIEVWVDREGR